MGSLPDATVTAFLDLPADGGNYFVLGDPVKGELGSADYLLTDGVATVLPGGFDIQIQRGRATELEDVSPGTCTVSFRNFDRRYDGMNTSGPYHGFLKAARPFHVEVYGQRVFTGEVDDWYPDYLPSGEASAMVVGLDGLGVLVRAEFDAWTTTGSQLTGTRIAAVLNRSEVAWPTAKRSLDAGQSTLQSDNVSHGSNPLNYLQLLAQSDLGVVFVDRNGQFVFRDRHAVVNGVSVAAFSDDVGIPFHGASESSAKERYVNKVSIDREGGTLQTAKDEILIGMDGPRSFTRTGLLLDSDVASKAMANFLLNTRKSQSPHIETITVNVSALTASQQATVCALDIYDVVSVEWSPLGLGSRIEEQATIEGIHHSIPYGGPHVAVFTLSPLTQTSVFILGDSNLGVLGGPGRLAF